MSGKNLRDLGFTAAFLTGVLLTISLLPVVYSNWTAIIQLRGQVAGLEAELLGVKERLRLAEQRIRRFVGSGPRIQPTPKQPEKSLPGVPPQPKKSHQSP